MVSMTTLLVWLLVVECLPSDGKSSIDSVRDALGIYCRRHKQVPCLTGL